MKQSKATGHKPRTFGDDPFGISARVKEVRLRFQGYRGASTFASALGCSISTYHYYEFGRVPPVTLIDRISVLTGLSLEYLIRGQATQADQKLLASHPIAARSAPTRPV